MTSMVDIAVGVGIGVFFGNFLALLAWWAAATWLNKRKAG